MGYEVLAIFWLLMCFYGSITLYIIGTEPSRVKQTSRIAEAEAQESLPYDFANIVYSRWWLDTFSCSNGYGKAYWLNNYLGIARKHDFAIPGKECATWWKDMIKQAKPQSPTRRIYYDHISVAKPFWHEDKDYHIVIHDRQPGYPEYSSNGYGFPNDGCCNGGVTIGKLTPVLCGKAWLDQHYEKYPGGFLPEQTMTRGKVTALTLGSPGQARGGNA